MPNTLMIFLIVAALLVGVLLIRAFGSGRAGGFFSPYRPKALMTRHETVFYQKLATALRGTQYIICPQVSMAAIMDVKSSIESHERLGLRNKFDRKIIDFVIADEKGKARLIVELDDSSHNASKDRDRDALTAAAGYVTLRYRNANSVNPKELRNDLANVIRAQE